MIQGLVTEEQVDSFNLPIYIPSPEEMTFRITQNGDFTIEAMELTNPSPSTGGPIDVRAWMTHVRVAMEVMFLEHFQKDTIDKLFARLCAKLSEASDELEATYRDGIQLFLVLKRK